MPRDIRAYIYQLIATDEKGRKQVVRKRMMLLKKVQGIGSRGGSPASCE